MDATAPAPGGAEKQLLQVLEEQARAAARSRRQGFSSSAIAALVERAQGELHQVARRTGQPVERVAELALARVETVRAARSRPPAALHLEQVFAKMTPAQQCRLLFTDRNTGLFNLRGLEVLRPPAGRPVLAEWDIEAAKFINDHYGHDALDGVLRTAATALAREITDGAKVGGSLRGYVRDQGEAKRIATAIEEALDPERRLRVTAAVAAREPTIRETITKSAEAHGELKKLERATGRLGYRLGGPVALMQGAPSIAFEEGMEGVDPKSPRAKRLLAEVATRVGPLVERHRTAENVEILELRPEHAQAFSALSCRAVAEAVYIEPSTGLLTEDGFRAQPEKKWKASIDMRGLRDLDHALGHEGADKVIAVFGRVIAKAAESRIDAGHLHGDEYVVQASSHKALRRLLMKIGEDCEKLGFFKELKDRRIVVVRGVQFAWGIGKTYERADRVDLPRRKERLPEARKPTLVSARRADRVVNVLVEQGAVNLKHELTLRKTGLALVGLDEPKERALGMER